VHIETVLPAGTITLTASSGSGNRIAAATAGTLREIGWGGLTLPVQMAARSPLARVRAGERLATVTVRGASTVTTDAVAEHSLGSPSLGWRLEHLL
jgi:hypothetical protein